MATEWLKSLHCKSNVLEDVFLPPPIPHSRLHHKPKPVRPPPSSTSSPSSFSTTTTTSSSSTKKTPLLPIGCGNTPLALRDVLLPSKPPPPPPPPPTQHQSTSHRNHHQKQKQSRPTKQSKPTAHRRHPTKPKNPSPLLPASSASAFSTLTELPRGHSSRRVVEIIFSSSWSLSGTDPFPGEIEMLFKVHNPARTVARFEEYRDAVRSRAGPGDARCAADGNEMMRFHSAAEGPETKAAEEPIYDAAVVWSSSAGGGGGIRTFAGSGGAHGSGRGGARRGRRAMLVCRVIAGRVRTGSNPVGPEEYESVAVGKGELLVFDPGAVLPCFLIIYKI